MEFGITLNTNLTMIYFSTLITALAVLFMIKPEIVTKAVEHLEEYPIALRCLFVVLTTLLLLQLLIIFT